MSDTLFTTSTGQIIAKLVANKEWKCTKIVTDFKLT